MEDIGKNNRNMQEKLEPRSNGQKFVIKIRQKIRQNTKDTPRQDAPSNTKVTKVNSPHFI